MNPIFPSPETSLLRRALRVGAAGVIGGAVVTALGLTGHTLVEDESLRVYQVEFVGDVRVPEAHLRHLADIRRGQHVLTLDLDAAARGVERHPWVAEAGVQFTFPSTVTVMVREHEPVMLLALEQLWYVDAAGRPFHQASSQSLDFPVLSGIPPELVAAEPELCSAIIGRALELLSATEAPPIYGEAAISEVRFHSQTGFTLVLRSGTELALGFADPVERLERLNQMVAAGLDLQQPQRVDLNAERVAIATPLPDL